MAIYKSSFNKKPDREEKKAREPKPKREAKETDSQSKPKLKVNKAAVSLLVFAILLILCIPSNFIKSFILGLIGLSIYPICIIGVCVSILYLTKRPIRVDKKYIIYLTSALVIAWFIFHLILTSKIPLSSYGSYLASSFKAKTTAGGILFSLLSYPATKYLTYVGAYIFSAIFFAIFVGLIVDYVKVEKVLVREEKKPKFDFQNIENFETDEKPKEVSPEEKQKIIAKQKLGLDKGESTIISSSLPSYELGHRANESRPMSKREYILTPIEPVLPTDTSDDLFLDSSTGYYNSKKIVRENVDQPQEEKQEFQNPYEQSDFSAMQKDSSADLTSTSYKNSEEIVESKPSEEIKESKPREEKSTSDFNIFDALSPSEEREEQTQSENYESQDEQDNNDTASEEEYDDIFEDDDSSYEDVSSSNDYSDLDNLDENYTEDTTKTEEVHVQTETHDYLDEYSNVVHDDNLGSTNDREVVRPSVDISKFNLPNMVKKSLEPEKEKPEPKKKAEIPPYVAPPVDLLQYMDAVEKISDEELQDNIDRLEQVLEDFKVPAKVNNVQVGPAVTRYELTMPRGISVNKIAQMSDDIAMTLASNGAIRVEAPIPGKNAVGIEVPNNQVTPVSLRELIDSNEFRTRGNPLSFVLGKDINGDIIFCNLDKMPHVLVAGSTGSGKSVCLNTMLLSLCYKCGPQDLRLILVDPKMVEFSTYNGLPHLLIPEVIIGKDMTINALDWSIAEMERRYALFAKNHVVNINEFNKLEMVKNKVVEKLPFIVIVVDELADLMLEAKREIEDRIAKLAAKARAAGIHLVLATQRPSVDVITGTVKANLPSRIAFALTNYMDSKTVLDGGGAEKLLGKGDMLFKPQDKPEPRRIQGAYVTNAEISAVVQFIKDHNNPVFDEDAGSAITNPRKSGANSGDKLSADESEFDPVLKDALRLFIQNKQASGSMISRRYSVGFNRAGRIMDQMERAGFIGPQEGSKPRQVIISMEEYKQIFGDDE